MTKRRIELEGVCLKQKVEAKLEASADVLEIKLDAAWGTKLSAVLVNTDGTRIPCRLTLTKMSIGGFPYWESNDASEQKLTLTLQGVFTLPQDQNMQSKQTAQRKQNSPSTPSEFIRLSSSFPRMPSGDSAQFIGVDLGSGSSKSEIVYDESNKLRIENWRKYMLTPSYQVSFRSARDSGKSYVQNLNIAQLKESPTYIPDLVPTPKTQTVNVNTGRVRKNKNIIRRKKGKKEKRTSPM